MKKRSWRVLFSMALVSLVSASNTITGYKGGISVVVNGTDGTDYAFERFYSDSLFDDHGVIYIKAGTQLRMEHNFSNVACITGYNPQVIGANGQDGTPNSGDEGLIRFRVDRDYQINKFSWSAAAGTPYPAYTAPFTFASLNYEAGVPVLGTTGPKPGTLLSDRSNFYWRGVTDEFGDEWHTITVADDDEWVCTKHGNGCTTWGRWVLASDGKVYYFVVNPTTPLVYFTTAASGAQYYTTPAKTYFVPKIHSQTTYLTGNVDIRLVNIMNGNPVYYRIDNGGFQQYNGPISSNTLSDGEHTLEYYYQDAYHKTRKLVKNPPYPSDLDNIAGVANYQHGYLMWKSDAELEAIAARNTGTEAREPYISNYRNARSSGPWAGCNQDGSNATYHKGYRWPGGERMSALHNALMAMIEGFNARINTNPPFVEYAKRYLMDNELSLDPTGYEVTEGGAVPKPGLEIYDGLGYYARTSVVSFALAYDALITKYRPPQYPNGFTAIEDLRLRDVLARCSPEALMEMGTYSMITNQIHENGMTGAAAEFTALIAAMAMPSYSTSYYGTSGFDGNTQTYLYTPYPDHAVTWKGAFFDQNTTRYSFPNQVLGFGMDEMITTSARTRTDDRVCPAGSFTNRPGYYGILLMGHLFHAVANVMKIRLDYSYVNLEKSFDYSNKGTMYSLQINASGDELPYHYPQLMLVNEHFPDLAGEAYDYLVSQGSGDNGFGNQLYWTDPLGMVWFHDDWENFVAPVTDKNTAGHLSVPAVYPNPVAKVLSFILPTSPKAGAFTVYTSWGQLVSGTVIGHRDTRFVYPVADLENGLYFYQLEKGNHTTTGRFVKAR